MTQIFAFIGPANDKKKMALFAGADCEGTDICRQTKDPNVQKLFVPGGEYFLMGSGSLLFVHETAHHISENIHKISNTEGLANKVLEFSDELSDKRTRKKQNKPFLEKEIGQGLEFIVCGPGKGAEPFEIYHIDSTGTGFMLLANLYTHGFQPGRFEKGKEKKYVAVAGSGAGESGTLINAFNNRSSEGPASILHMPYTKYPLVNNMIFHTYLADTAATSQGVGREVQYGFMTKEDDISVLFPANMKFSDVYKGMPTSESNIANAYLQTLFKSEVNDENFSELKEKADQLHSKYSTALRHLKKYGEECTDIGFNCLLDPSDNFEDNNELKLKYLTSAQTQATHFKAKARFIQRLTNDILKKGPRLLDYGK